MRITRDLLLKITHNTIKQRKRTEPDLLAAYLVGSLLDEEPLLGGLTDIDLVLVHKYQVPAEREVVQVTPDITLDIFHKLRDSYDQHKQLRHDPWLGYPLTKNHIMLFDTDHWLEFIQAGVSAQFHRPDNILARVNLLLNSAREQWFELIAMTPEDHLIWLHGFMNALQLSANALIGLNSAPLTTRRFLLEFDQRTKSLGVPKTFAAFTGLIGITQENLQESHNWIHALADELQKLTHQSNPPPHLKACRHAYYLNALQALAESGDPVYAVWPLLKIWLDVRLAAETPPQSSPTWEKCLGELHLSPEHCDSKQQALDAFLDTVEITIETWADEYGI